MTSTETLAQVNYSAKVLDHIETSTAEIRKIVQNIEGEARSAQSEKTSKGPPLMLQISFLNELRFPRF
jgi:hypothetical protein